MRNRLMSTLFLIITFSGCTHVYKKDFEKIAKKETAWTENQRKAALGYSYRLKFAVNKGGRWEVNYAILTTAQVRENLDSLLENIDYTLSYKDRWEVKYVEAFKLRSYLEREEERLKAIRSWVRTAELYQKFQLIMKNIPREDLYEEHSRQKISGYNPKLIFGSTDVAKAFPFKVEEIESAKQREILKPIEHLQIALERRLDRKEQNPADPDDPNSTIWRSLNRATDWTNYKILVADNPENNQGNYFEGHRVVEGKKESLPAIRIFCLSNEEFCVLLLDADKEGMVGFGLPDAVEPIRRVASVTELAGNLTLMDQLFQEKKESSRIPPKKKPIFVEIAKVAGTESSTWEESPTKDGWQVPFQYKNQLQNNYNIKLVFQKPELSSETVSGMDKQIKYFKKEWTQGSKYTPSIGNVIEYYPVKPPYNKRNLLEARVNYGDNTKKINLVFNDGTEENGVVIPKENRFIENDPAMIDYTEGSKRWRIRKDDGSKVFNKRKGMPLSLGENTGEYNYDKIEVVD